MNHQCIALIVDYDILIGADTAGSAKYISEQKILDTAAIASSLAAKYMV